MSAEFSRFPTTAELAPLPVAGSRALTELVPYERAAPTFPLFQAVRDAELGAQILTHEEPDGDAIASAALVYRALTEDRPAHEAGRHVVVNLGEGKQVPPSHRSLARDVFVGAPEAGWAYPVAFVTDTSNPSYMEAAGALQSATQVIDLEHHGNRNAEARMRTAMSPDAQLHLVDLPQADSAGLVVSGVREHLDGRPTHGRSAVLTYMSLMHDTRNLQLPTTREASVGYAVHLRDQMTPEELRSVVAMTKRLFPNTPGSPREQYSLPLRNLEVAKGRAVLLVGLDTEGFEHAAALNRKAGHHFPRERLLMEATNELTQVWMQKSHAVSVLVTQLGVDAYDIKFRSIEPGVAQSLAQAIGGDGHPQMAAMQFKGRGLAYEGVVSLVARLLNERLA